MRLEPLTESGVCRMGGVNAKGTPRADDPCTIWARAGVAERRKALSGLGVGHLTPSAAQHDLTERGVTMSDPIERFKDVADYTP